VRRCRICPVTNRSQILGQVQHGKAPAAEGLVVKLQSAPPGKSPGPTELFNSSVMREGAEQ
jgi:hypothetical protein